MSRYLATSDFFIGASAGSTNIPSMHYHASYELYYLQVGHRDYFIEDKLFSVSAGDFVLIPPRKLHRTGGEYGERILIGFTAEFLEKVYTKSCDLVKKELSNTNSVIESLIQALRCKPVRSLLSFERVLRYLELLLNTEDKQLPTVIKENYYNDAMLTSEEMAKLINVNEAMRKKVAQLKVQMDIVFLTKSAYN